MRSKDSVQWWNILFLNYGQCDLDLSPMSWDIPGRLHTPLPIPSRWVSSVFLWFSAKGWDMDTTKRMTWGPGEQSSTPAARLGSADIFGWTLSISPSSIKSNRGVSTTVTIRSKTFPWNAPLSDVTSSVGKTCFPRIVFPVELFPVCCTPSSRTRRVGRVSSENQKK